MTRDISPAAKQVSANILKWLGYSVIACGQALRRESRKVKRRRRSLLGQLSNNSPSFKHEDVQNEFFSKGKDC